MEAKVVHGPGASATQIRLEPNEVATAEAGAMIAMSGDVKIETTTHKKGSGGVLSALKRLLAGESFFLNHFTAGARGGEVWVATTLPGDMLVHTVDGSGALIVQSGSFVACDEKNVTVDVGWQGFKNMFSGESLFWLRIHGKGTLVLSSFGAIYPITVDGEYIVDTGHIVAFQESLSFSLSKAGKSWMSSFLGGEGIICKFKGKGVVWCQSHHPGSFGGALGPLLSPR